MHLVLNLGRKSQQVRVIDAQNLDQGLKKRYDHQFDVALSGTVPIAYKVSVQDEHEYRHSMRTVTRYRS